MSQVKLVDGKIVYPDDVLSRVGAADAQLSVIQRKTFTEQEVQHLTLATLLTTVSQQDRILALLETLAAESLDRSATGL